MPGRPPAALFLIRHADAGDRTRYRGEDLGRPLSAKGHRQSAAIAERLGKRPIAALLSSPARRCRETLLPLSSASGLPLEEFDALVEGAEPSAALTALLARAPRPEAPLVACSHGDVLGAIVERLFALGLPTKGKARLPKGMTIEVALDASGKPEHLTFVPPK